MKQVSVIFLLSLISLSMCSKKIEKMSLKKENNSSEQFSFPNTCCKTDHCGGFDVCRECCSNAYITGPGINCSWAVACAPIPLFCNNFDKSAKCCKSCDEGLYISQCACAGCMANCQKCSNGSSCDKCNNGFYFASGQCKQCTMANYIECNATSCITCKSGFFLKSGVCTPCSNLDPNCDVCDAYIDSSKIPHYVCSTCKTGFNAKKPTAQVNGAFSDTCQGPPPNCNTYDPVFDRCLFCKDGYVPNMGKCTDCAWGYKKNSSGACVKA